MKKKIHVAVRDDLQVLVLKAPVSETGETEWTPKQKKQLSEWQADHKWEWLWWVLAGKSQSHGPLKANFLQMHEDLKEAMSDLPAVID